jgi:N-terminal domain of reverse transcriptase
MGKLDTVTVNGPEGDVVDWDAVDWRAVEDDVRRLRQRIFTATQAGDLKKVRNLQKLMLRSRGNALLSVRRGDGAHALPAPPARRLCRCPGTLQPRLTPSGLA